MKTTHPIFMGLTASGPTGSEPIKLIELVTELSKVSKSPKLEIMSEQTDDVPCGHITREKNLCTLWLIDALAAPIALGIEYSLLKRFADVLGDVAGNAV